MIYKIIYIKYDLDNLILSKFNPKHLMVQKIPFKKVRCYK